MVKFDIGNKDKTFHLEADIDLSGLKIGDKVKTGQIIGYSGKTGWIAHLGPHLHFDVHIYLSNNFYSGF